MPVKPVKNEETVNVDNAPADEAKNTNDRITVAGSVDREVWERAESKAFMEHRVKTNSGIVALAIRLFADK